MTRAHPNIDFAMGFRYRNAREILYSLGGILLQEPTEILILPWEFATGARGKSCTYLGDSITGVHQNADFAMGFRYGNPREILYLLGGLYNKSPHKY